MAGSSALSVLKGMVRLMKVKNTILCLVVLSLLIATVPLGCGPAQIGEKQTYTIGDVQGDWGYPTPFLAYPRGPGYVRTTYLFDTLVWKDDQGFVPALAEKWEYHEEDLSYTFDLREDVKWHDGTSFSAEDVVFSFEYLKKHPYNWVNFDSIEEVIKLDEYSVEIKMEEPDAAFLNNIAGVMHIIPKHIWESVENPAEFSDPEAVIGTGPYKLQDYQREKGYYRYAAFEDYYSGSPAFEELLMVKVSDAQMAVQRGDVNFMQVQPEAVSQLEERDLLLISGNHNWNLKLMFNHQEEPFKQKEFRHAVAHAIDLENLVERALRGHGLPGSPGLISPDSYWFNPELPDYSYDPEKAEEMFQGLGYEKEGSILQGPQGELNFELIVYEDYAREAEIVKEFLEQAGIKITVRSMEQSVVDTRVQNRDFDLAINGHGGVGGDPAGIPRFIVGEERPHINARYNEDPVLIETAKAQGKEVDEEKRLELVQEMQERFAEPLPAYTLYYPTWYYAHDGAVDWFFTHDGIGAGTPIPLNKLALLEN